MIKIKVISCNNEPFYAEFDKLGGNIGRADGNILVLPDPEKHISRIHATVEYREGNYHICNHGSATPVFLNGSPLNKEQSESIKIGDEIRIGKYIMQVKSGDSPTNTMFDDAPRESSQTESLDNDPFKKDFFDTAQKDASTADENFPSADSVNTDSFAADKDQASSDIIPEDFNPFADLPASDDIFKNAQAQNQKNQLFNELDSSAPGENIDRVIDPPTPLDELTSQSKQDNMDPLALVNDGAKEKSVDFRIQPDDTPVVHDAVNPPKLKKETETHQTQQSNVKTSPISKSLSEEQVLLDSFLAGAGLQDRNALSSKLTPELMHLIGQLLRETTQGTLDLLLARSMTKQEMHATLTLIASKENNPLKFSPDVETALTHLLSPQSQGFMAPQQSIKDAYDDLRSHQFGFMAGMRAALANVLESFNPQKLEQRLAKKSVIDNMIPINHRAKLWNLFNEHYKEISRDAEEDFHALFGKEFLKAYEAQIAKLREEDEG